MIWLPELGVICLLSAVACSFFGFVTQNQRLWVGLQGLCVLFAFLLLGFLFYHNDFSVAYVYNNSNTGLPWYYRLSAVWGAHEGSLLLWLLWLNVWTFFVIVTERWDPTIQRITVSVLSFLHSAFALFIVSLSNPFARILPIIPKEGSDLNPLLQDLGLILHPPVLYGGYVGFFVPFALVIALLWKGKPADPWAHWLKPWVVVSLVFLTVGITLGSWWAYYELGWGGWWFWDPVENASLMPWISGIALLHLLMLHKMTRSYTAWCFLVTILTFGLCLMGTFLVRSGILTSIHAFATDPGRGFFILLFITVVLGAGLMLYAIQIPRFVDRSYAPTLKSKGFLVAIGLMLGVCATVLLGTLYPLFVDAWWGQKLSVGPPYFDKVIAPFMVPLVLLCAFLPGIPVSFRLSGGCFVVGAVLLFFLLPMGRHWLLTYIGLLGAWLLFFSTINTLFLRYKQTGSVSFGGLGMGFAHIGFAVLLVGISLVTHLEVETDLRLKVGDHVAMRHWTFVLDGFQRIDGSNYQGIQAKISVFKKKSFFTHLYPEKRYYSARDISLTETALSPGLFQDLYVALSTPISSDEWIFRIYLKPFVRWIWLGGLMMAFGLMLTQFKRHNKE